jgi:hypothetical protein
MTQATTTPRRVFRDRREAGRVLARLLNAYRGRPDVVVLGLPRGGIPRGLGGGGGARRLARRVRGSQARRARTR